jgi:ribonuclease HI
MLAWDNAWQHQEQPTGIISTASEKFKGATTEPQHPQTKVATQQTADTMRQIYPPSPLAHQWRTYAYTDGSRMDTNTGEARNTAMGAGLYIPAYEDEDKQAEFTIDPAGWGETNTINRAELAGIYAALVKHQRKIATDSATSIAQVQRMIHRPATLRMHKHADLLTSIGKLLRDAPGPVTIVKIKAHAGHIGNEVADQIAKRAATPESMDEPDLTLPIRGRASYTKSYWLFSKRNEADVAQHPKQRSEPVESLKGHLRQVIHEHQRLGFSNQESYYFRKWQSIRNEAHGSISNGLMRPNKNLSGGQVKVALKYRMGLLWNNRLAFKWGKAPNNLCPLCGSEDGGTHMVSACQHTGMQGMYTDRHNKLGRTIMRAVMKGERGGEIASMDLGAADKAKADGLHITTRRYVPREVLPHMKDADIHKLKPDAILISGDSHADPKSRQVHIMELKTCQDTDPQSQLQRAAGQHSALQKQLLKAGFLARNIHIVPILVGVSGTIYHTHTLEALQKLGVTKTRAKRCAHKLHLQAISCMHSIVATRHALVGSQTSNSHHNHGSGQSG